MNEHDDHGDPVDELGPYDDLVRALRAPGSRTELADEQRFLAAYRETHGPSAPVVSLPRRLAGRLGAGGTALIVVAVVSSGGVAAAFTGNLPDPVQELAHSVLGAPAPQSPELKRAAPGIERLPEPESATATPDASPSVPPEPSVPAGEQPDKPDRQAPTSAPGPTPPAKPGAVAPTTEPHDDPTQGPTKPPEPKPPGRLPAVLTMSATSHVVEYGATLTLTGQVSASDGEPVGGRVVVLQIRDPNRWRPVSRSRSDSTGVVTASTAPVTGLDRYRWRVRAPLRSPVWRVRVKSAVTASYTVDGDQTTVTATSRGASPGDPINFYVIVKKKPTLVGTARLGANGTAEFTVPSAERRRALMIRLEGTRDHTAARTRIVVLPPG